jgi:hypothetical protein
MTKTVGFRILVFLLLCPFLFGQDSRFDVSLNAAGELPKQTTGNGITLSPTSSVGFLATGRLKIAPKVDLEANWERGTDSQKYYTGGLFYQISSDVTELSGAVVFHPFQRGKWDPFVLGGGGILAFGPSSTVIDGATTAIGALRQIQPAFLYGVGSDYRLSSNFALRLQYRGLFYQPPDYKVPYLFTGGHGHMAEPAIGIVFHF